jgi:hypothetical protein
LQQLLQRSHCHEWAVQPHPCRLHCWPSPKYSHNCWEKHHIDVIRSSGGFICHPAIPWWLLHDKILRGKRRIPHQKLQSQVLGLGLLFSGHRLVHELSCANAWCIASLLHWTHLWVGWCKPVL